MERLALIGVSHRRGGAAALEAWQGLFGSPSETTTPEALRGAGFTEWVSVSTCNRCDLVVALRTEAFVERVEDVTTLEVSTF